MKKIIVSVICLLFLACTSDKETSTIPENLIGSWKAVGYYDDVENPLTGTNYFVTENGPITNFKSDSTFENIFSSTEIYGGSFTVINTSILSLAFTTTASGESYSDSVKIITLTDSLLILGPVTDAYGGGGVQYEKIVTP